MKARNLIDRVMLGESASSVASSSQYYIMNPQRIDRKFLQVLQDSGIEFETKEGKFVFNSEMDAIEASRLFKYHKLDGRVYPYPGK